MMLTDHPQQAFPLSSVTISIDLQQHTEADLTLLSHSEHLPRSLSQARADQKSRSASSSLAFRFPSCGPSDNDHERINTSYFCPTGRATTTSQPSGLFARSRIPLFPRQLILPQPSRPLRSTLFGRLQTIPQVPGLLSTPEIRQVPAISTGVALLGFVAKRGGVPIGVQRSRVCRRSNGEAGWALGDVAGSGEWSE